jgi:small subunit ribosomal protein S2
MEQLPDVVILVDPKREGTAIAECRKLNIPILSIIDTNCDPNVIDIPIPANDDAVKSIKLIISTLSDAIISGKPAVMA